MDELRAMWMERLSDEERVALASVSPATLTERVVGRDVVAELAAVEHAVLQCFERQSVVPEKRLLAEALTHGVGHVTVAGVHELLAQHPVIRRELGGRAMVTTQEVLAEENRMLRFVREGRDKAAPLNADWKVTVDSG